MPNEVPWAWYLSRSSALLGFFLLWLSMFFGLTIRTPLLNRLINPFYSYRTHCLISLQALVFAAIHGVSLLGDKFINFNLGNIFIPFFPQTDVDPVFLALGIAGFYIMLVLVVTSYLRAGLSPSFWRAVHSLNVGLFVIVFIHALYLGTDMKNAVVRDVFIGANLFLGALLVINLFLRLARKFKNNADIR